MAARTAPRVRSFAVLPRLLAAALLASAPLAAQVPDGWVVFGSFQGVAGRNGIFFAHPRDGASPWIEVTGLSPALAYDPSGRRGASSVLRRPDGALVVGERAPAGTSVDVHVLRLSGAAVVHAQLFSAGTSASAGEIPQCALLPDGRIAVAATDLTAGGPLAQFQTAQYHWEGIGILDPESGAVVPIAIPNLSQLPGVINGMAASADGATLYVGNYVSTVAGDLWAVPVAGGAATQVATLPAGASNVAVDLDGTVLVATLNGPPNLFRYDPVSGATTPVATASGPLNALAVETVTGNAFLATANAGVPARSLVWMTPSGVETLLVSPSLATISGVDLNPNPESYGAGTAGTAEYGWRLRPNPGGLPVAGNASFALAVRANRPMTALAMLLIGFDRQPVPLVVEGLSILVAPGTSVSALHTFQDERVFPLPIPADPWFVGLAVRAQTLFLEQPAGTLAASPGVEFTVL